MKKLFICFILSAAVLNVPLYAGMIYTDTTSTSWLGAPAIAIGGNPPAYVTSEGTNNGRYVLGQSFKILAGMPLKLDKIAILGDGPSQQSFINLRIQDLGLSSPTNYAVGTDLLSVGAWLYPGSNQKTVKEFDFTGVDEIILQIGHTYVFEFVDNVSTGGMWWCRGGTDSYANGKAYIAVGSSSANRQPIVVSSSQYRDMDMAVYLVPEPATIGFLGLGVLTLIRRKK